MIGIKGVGMAALAEILLANGFSVAGSDSAEQFVTDSALKRLRIAVAPFGGGFSGNVDAVVRSNAYGSDHADVKSAVVSGIPIFSYPEVVAELFNESHGIAIAGTHGKTTTTAMLAHILKSAGKNPVALVGSLVPDWKSGALGGNVRNPKTLFALEADEYKDAFLNYRPYGAIITNIEYDHPDYFKTPGDYQDAFAAFAARISPKGFLIIHEHDVAAHAAARAAVCTVITVSENSMLSIELQVIGRHNKDNARLAYHAALHLGVSEQVARNALSDFQGTARRMEFVGEKNGALIFDDYAHHPTEIRVSLSALSERYPEKKIVAIFQPHTYSRTKALFFDFCSAFDKAHVVILSGIYTSAREQKDEYGIMEEMVSCMRQRGKDTVLIKSHDGITRYLEGVINSETVVATLGAGDIWRVARLLC